MLDRLAELYVQSHPDLSPRYRENVLRICGRCNARIDKLDRNALAHWLAEQLESRSPQTVIGYRRVLNAVLKWAFAEGLVEKLLILPVIRPRRAAPRAWTIEDVRKLLRTAETWPGMVGRHPAGLWWSALLETLYWTAARIGSVLSARPDDWISDRRLLYLWNSKGRRRRPYLIHPSTAKKLDQLVDKSVDRLFVWPHSRHYLFRVLRRIVNAAGVPYQPGMPFQLTHAIRRTCASYLWRVDPTLAQRHLDHCDPKITFYHYVDPAIGRSEPDVTGILPFPWG